MRITVLRPQTEIEAEFAETVKCTESDSYTQSLVLDLMRRSNHYN